MKGGREGREGGEYTGVELLVSWLSVSNVTHTEAKPMYIYKHMVKPYFAPSSSRFFFSLKCYNGTPFSSFQNFFSIVLGCCLLVGWLAA